jgi:predicted nucleic acid-binding protein
MKRLLLDTNILIQLVRGNKTAKEVKSFVEKLTDPQIFISVVNIAEAESLVVQWNWGKNNVESLRKIIENIITIDIEQNNQPLLDTYVNIDAFSQGKISSPSGKKLNNSARNMGKNDLWIAATAHAMDAILLTTDGDFDHLQNIFFEVQKF